MERKDVIFSRREILNLDGFHSVAAISANIVDRSYSFNIKAVDVSLDISDCTRSINLDIDLESQYERENAIYKVTTLIDVLSDFKEAIIHQSKILKKEEIKKTKEKIKKLDTEEGSDIEVAELREKLNYLQK